MQSHRPCIVGIGGGTASGKSTLANRLAEALSDLRLVVIGMDRYFKAVKPVHRAPLTGREWPDFNQPESFHLDKLVADLDATIAQCEREASAAAAREAPQVIIVEGLMTLQHASLRERLDLRVFVDAPADERIVRRLRRNMAERGLSFDEIADYYLQCVRFRHEEYVEQSRWQADVIINGVTLPERATTMLAEYIRRRVGECECPR